MRFIFLCFFLVVFLAACRSREKLPIPEDQLVVILADIHQAEAAINEEAKTYERDSLTDRYYDYIYQIHQVEEVDLEASLNILKNDLPRMERLYKQVLEELRVREAGLRSGG